MSQFNDYSATPHYSNGGAGGGGYLAGSPSFGSQSPGGSGRKTGLNSLRPVTIKQAISASQSHSDAELFLDDVELGQLSVVAQVITIQAQTTNSVYWLDDGTGRMEARNWIDSSNDEDTDKWGGVTEGIYVRVTGVLKTFGTKRYINATHIRAVVDHHELWFHLLEAMAVTLTYTRGAPPKPGDQNQNAHGAANGHPSVYTHTVGAPVSDQYAHLPPLDKKIIEFILAQPPKEEGVHIAAIAGAMRTDSHQISQAMDRLSDEGHVFSTIDDLHFSVSN